MAATLLLATVGGSPEPLVASIRHHRPDRVGFVASKDSRPLVAQQILPQLGELLRPGQVDCYELNTPDDFERCVQDLEPVQRAVEAWWSREDAELVVDITGGTKCMAAALACLARTWDCRYSYVGGQQRDRSGLGVVLPGSERVQSVANPWHSHGRLLIDEALAAFDQGLAEGAVRLLEAARQRLSGAAKRTVATLHALAEGYAAWDRFEHKLAASRLDDALRNAGDLRCLGGREAAVQERLAQHQQWLQALGKGLSRSLLLDLYANAERSAQLGRYDDAVARLYRCAELAAQLHLRARNLLDERHAHVLWAALPAPLQQDWQPRSDEGRLRLGLQDSYRLLGELGDPLGQRFRDLGLAQRGQSPLETRNSSILAHGSSPVGMKGWQNLQQVVQALAGIDPGELPLPWPKLRRV